jgi:hypothetical protein
MACPPTPSRHVELALYADDTAVMATSRKPELLVSCVESYLRDLERWLKEWRIAINVAKRTAMLFTRRRIQKLRPVLLFGEQIVWVDAARYLGAILDTRLTWWSDIDQVRKKAAQRMGVLGPLLHRRSGLYTERCSPLQAVRPSHDGLRVPSLSIASLLLSPEMRSYAGMAKQTRGRQLRFTQKSAPS